MASDRQVVGLELQAHGHTADIDRPLSMETISEDGAEAIRQLGIEPGRRLRLQLGAGVALRLAIKAPDLVRKLVLASAAINELECIPN